MKRVICIIVFVVLALGATVGGAILDKRDADRTYNNGICQTCGTKFHLVDVEHYRNGGNHYFYACENDHIIECKCRPSKIDE